MSETVSNKETPKCWWRYNNQGGKYKTCNYIQEGSNYKRIVRGPKITPEQYVEQEGVDYSDMSKAQVNEYHRLDMIQRRKAKKGKKKVVKKKPEDLSEAQLKKILEERLDEEQSDKKKKKKKKKSSPKKETILDLYDGVISKSLADAIQNSRREEYYSAIRFGSKAEVASLKKQYNAEDAVIRKAGQNVPPPVPEPGSIK